MPSASVVAAAALLALNEESFSSSQAANSNASNARQHDNAARNTPLISKVEKGPSIREGAKEGNAVSPEFKPIKIGDVVGLDFLGQLKAAPEVTASIGLPGKGQIRGYLSKEYHAIFLYLRDGRNTNDIVRLSLSDDDSRVTKIDVRSLSGRNVDRILEPFLSTVTLQKGALLVPIQFHDESSSSKWWQYICAPK